MPHHHTHERWSWVLQDPCETMWYLYQIKLLNTAVSRSRTSRVLQWLTFLQQIPITEAWAIQTETQWWKSTEQRMQYFLFGSLSPCTSYTSSLKYCQKNTHGLTEYNNNPWPSRSQKVLIFKSLIRSNGGTKCLELEEWPAGTNEYRVQNFI